MSLDERVCKLCGASEMDETLYKVDETDSECHGHWLCMSCYVDELADEPTEDTKNTEDYDEDAYEPEYEPDYDDVDDMDDEDIDDMLKELFHE